MSNRAHVYINYILSNMYYMSYIYSYHSKHNKNGSFSLYLAILVSNFSPVILWKKEGAHFTLACLDIIQHGSLCIQCTFLMLIQNDNEAQ